MAAPSSQAEKWKQWKQKMQENTIRKRLDEGAMSNVTSDVAKNDIRGGVSCGRGQGEAKAGTGTADKTLKMVREFIAQCQTRSDNETNETVGIRGSTNSSEPTTAQNISMANNPDIGTAEPPVQSKRYDHTGSNTKEFGGKTGNSKDNDTHPVGSLKHSSKSNVKDKLQTEDRPSKDRCVGKNKGLCNDATMDITVVGNSEKRPCSVPIGNNNASKKVNTVTKDKVHKPIEMPRRTVRFADMPDGKQDTDKVSTDKPDNLSVVEALQREGRRLMVDYMAEYDTSSESSSDEEVVKASGIQTHRIDDVRFTVHLSSSMKHIKPYRCVLFDVIETNEGKAYSATTGRFMAPQKGSYVFFLTTTAAIKERPEVSIIHNFHPVDPTKIKTNEQEAGDMRTKTDAILLSLERNDEIWILNVTRLSHVQELGDEWLTHCGNVSHNVFFKLITCPNCRHTTFSLRSCTPKCL